MKHALKYGGLAGVIMTSSWWLGMWLFPAKEEESFDFSQSEFLGYIALLLAMSMVIIGVRRYGDQMEEAGFSFKQAFGVGFNIVLVASMIYTIGWMVYYPNFMPDFYEQYAASQLTIYQEYGLTEAEIAAEKQALEDWIETYENPFIMAGMTFMEIFPMGLIIAAVSALIFKRK